MKNRINNSTYFPFKVTIERLLLAGLFVYTIILSGMHSNQASEISQLKSIQMVQQSVLNSMKTEINDLENQISDLESQINDLESRVYDLEYERDIYY